MEFKKSYEIIERATANIEKSIAGKRQMIELVMTGLIARSHVLIEDVPGIGKTTLAMALARTIGGDFSRIQMTADLLPGDIVGGLAFNPKTQDFEVRWGPIVGNIILCDEINRTTPKTQSALLECMAESQITIDKQTLNLKDPFMVIATQNPFEYEGCYNLGESQKDRFIISFKMGYPDFESEKAILKNHNRVNIRPEELTAAITTNDVIHLQNTAEKVKISDDVLEYILNIVTMTRSDKRVEVGASPRGAILLKLASCAYALLKNRSYVIYDDVKYLAPFVIGHRLQLNADQPVETGFCEKIVSECVNMVAIKA
ncbi:MAG: MoxR family ATPase [Candidatus Wallbacteria bacterium]